MIAAMIPLPVLTQAAWALSRGLSTNRNDDVSCDDVRARIDDETIFDLLEERLGKLSLNKQERAALLDSWQGYVSAVDAQRKFGIPDDGRGFALLLAYVVGEIALHGDP